MKKQQPHQKAINMIEDKPLKTDRRKLLGYLGVGGIAACALPAQWTKPIVNSVMLPAHAQTSCVTDVTFVGNLVGHPSGAANCADACADEAATQGAALCSSTSTGAPGSESCSCDLDLP